MKSAYFVIIFSFLIIFTASFVLEIKPAEAREATAHCATIGKNKDRMIKISYDQATGTHVCKTTLDHFGVDFTVPDRCGQIAGLYLTDKACQPPQQPDKPEPPRDRDGDGYPDSRDSCPREYSTTNNGCPPPERDSDRDGFPDSRDSCPREFSTTNNGCPAVPPAPDRDGDGFPDSRDSCPREFSTTNNGCPTYSDRDGDGIRDSLDRCMNNPETFNGYLDSDGCPDNQPSSPTRTQSDDWTGPIVGIILALIVGGIIAAIVKKKKTIVQDTMLFRIACPNCSTKLSEPDLDGNQQCLSCGWDSHQI